MRRKPARTSPAVQLFLTSSLSTTSTSSPNQGQTPSQVPLRLPVCLFKELLLQSSS